MSNRLLILASGSAQRRLLLDGLGISYEVVPAQVDEQRLTGPKHISRPEFLAQVKATSVSKLKPAAVVLAADTVVYLDDQLLEKPVDLTQASLMLRSISGRQVVVQTGVAIMVPEEKIRSQTISVNVEMRQLSEQEIAKYIATQPVLTWSAAFSPAYPAGAALVAAVTGSFTAFGYGLPIEVAVPWLREAGVM